MSSFLHSRKPLNALSVLGLVAFATGAMISAAGLAKAQAIEEITGDTRGFDIAARSDRSDRGFISSEVELAMVLRNAAGAEANRSLRLKTLEVPDENQGDKSLIIFDRPNDIEGTVLLSHAAILEPDDQWLFLPALRRVKRISSANKSGPFVGSEFAFEDFTAQELNKYDYEFLRTEACNDLECDVLERTPLYEASGYSRQIGWVDQEIFQPRKIEFYDRRGDLLKTLTFADYRQYDGRFWRPHLMQMVNHQTGKSTDLIYGEYRFDVGLGDSDFTSGALRRTR